MTAVPSLAPLGHAAPGTVPVAAPVPGPVRAAARLLVAGDTHGNLGWITRLVALAGEHGCAGVVQLGDFGFWPDAGSHRRSGRVELDEGWLDDVAGVLRAAGCWMRVIDGNHDFHPAVRTTYPAGADGVRPLRDGVLDWADRGAVWTWGGVRFGALGGGVSIDRGRRVEGLSWWPTEAITDDDVAQLTGRASAVGGLDVLLAHDAPALPPGIRPLPNALLHARCAASIEMVAGAVRSTSPRLVLHGHYHLRCTSIFELPRSAAPTSDAAVSGPATGAAVTVEGFASDIEAPTRDPWGILDLATLTIVPEDDL